MITKITVFGVLLSLALPLFAAENPSEPGQVTLSLPTYLSLIQGSADAETGRYAMGPVSLNARVRMTDERAVLQVAARVTVTTLEATETLIPLLGPGAALIDLRANEQPAQLVPLRDGFAWASYAAETVELLLVYEIAVRDGEDGYNTSIPVPGGSGGVMNLELPVDAHQVQLAPAAALEISRNDELTQVSATVMPTTHVALHWSKPMPHPYLLATANYRGNVNDDQALFDLSLAAETAQENVWIPLLASSLTLHSVTVNGKPAPIKQQDRKYSVRVDKPGQHRISVRFQLPIDREHGAPRVRFEPPSAPISQFSLTLPGRKELTIAPLTYAEHTFDDDATVASFYLPSTPRVQIAWTASVAESGDVNAAVKSQLMQAFHAAEGMLFGQALITYEIPRGRLALVRFAVPKETEVTTVAGIETGVVDWQLTPSEDGITRVVTVVLDQPTETRVALWVQHESPLKAEGTFAVPLLQTLDVTRQRGLVALLSGSELSLAPDSADNLNAVGENQIPADFRNRLQLPVTHTYKYYRSGPRLVASTRPPKKEVAKFDATLDTLFSISDVALKAQTSVAITVKSGDLASLSVALPENVELLSVTGPSIRSHTTTRENAEQRLDVFFTQGMQGQFRIELTYERLLDTASTQSEVPRATVLGAAAQHGRLAVESLAALRVGELTSNQLFAMDVAELPQQLVLKTTNPILLAYKFIQSDTPYKLVLEVTRHREVALQDAVIDAAAYQTLVTRDGLKVTHARFTVRNTQRQFLELTLPPRSEVWSLFVNGQAEKPALAEDEGSGRVLVRLVHSTEGFPIEITYAERADAMGSFGALAVDLPVTDMVLTRARWDLYLPEEFAYPSVQSTLDVIESGRAVNLGDAEDERGLAAMIVAPSGLKFDIPRAGRRFAFSKLYPQQVAQADSVALRYASIPVRQMGVVSSLFAVLLLWSGIWALTQERYAGSRWFALFGIGIGVLVTAFAYARLDASPILPAILSMAIATGWAARLALPRVRQWATARRGATN